MTRTSLLGPQAGHEGWGSSKALGVPNQGSLFGCYCCRSPVLSGRERRAARPNSPAVRRRPLRDTRHTAVPQRPGEADRGPALLCRSGSAGGASPLPRALRVPFTLSPAAVREPLTPAPSQQTPHIRESSSAQAAAERWGHSLPGTLAFTVTPAASRRLRSCPVPRPCLPCLFAAPAAPSFPSSPGTRFQAPILSPHPSLSGLLRAQDVRAAWASRHCPGSEGP